MQAFTIVSTLAICASLAAAAGSVSIDLTGLRIANATNQNRTSAPSTIDPAYKYFVDFSDDTMVRGQGGLLAVLYPNPVPLAQFMESFQAGSSAALHTVGNNPSGTNPYDSPPQMVSGSGSGLSFAMTLSAGISAANVAYFSITNVALSPSFVGALLFTSGHITIAGGCIGDYNNDGGVDGGDIGAFFQEWSDGLTEADVNGDGGVDGQDVEFFFVRWSGGC